MDRLNLRWIIILWRKIIADDAFGLAAQLAYFFLLSLFPLLIFLITLLPYLPLTVVDVLGIIADFAPGDTMKFIETNINDIMSHHNGKLLSLGLIGTLWSASNGMKGIMRALNKAYHVKENRSYFVSRGLSILFTVAMIFVFILALLLPVFGKHLGVLLFSQFGLSNEFLRFWDMFRWGISAIILFIIFLALYWMAPNKKFRCIDAVPGAVFASLFWLITSYGFSFYVNNFGNYSVTYGSLGAVIVLMIWFYLLGLIIIIGGEINALYTEMKSKNC